MGCRHQNQIACSVPALSSCLGPLNCESNGQQGGGWWCSVGPTLPSSAIQRSRLQLQTCMDGVCSLTTLCRNLILVETVMHVSTWRLQPSESTLSASSSSSTPCLLAAMFFSPRYSAVCLNLCFVTMLPDFRHSALSSELPSLNVWPSAQCVLRSTGSQCAGGLSGC